MFKQDKHDGQICEEFFEQYGKSLLFPPDDPRIPVMLKRFEPEQGYYTDWPKDDSPDKALQFGIPRKTTEEIHIEGADIEAFIMNPASDGNAEHGWIEIKAIKHNAMILYGRDGYPSLPFEITSQRGSKKKGWLWDLLHPLESCEHRRFMPDGLRTVSPSALVFCQYENEITGSSPYAVVSFFDFLRLKNALIEIAKERYRIDLIEWRRQGAKDYDERWTSEYHSPYWNVSLKWLQDKHVPMAITLFDNEPAFERDSYYRVNMRKYQRLKDMATAQFVLDQLKETHEKLKIPDQEPEWTT